MPDRSAASSDATARRVSDLVWIAWLVAAGILVVLTVNVVRHLAAGGAHEHPSAALFRAGEARTLRPLLSSAVLTEWQVNAVALALLVLGLAWYVTGTALVRRRTGECGRGGARRVSWPASRCVRTRRAAPSRSTTRFCSVPT